MQTFIDRYIEQGREQGHAQGFDQGRQHGEAAVLLRQIERKFGPPSEAIAQRIRCADADTLLDWSERILSASSVDAVVH